MNTFTVTKITGETQEISADEMEISEEGILKFRNRITSEFRGPEYVAAFSEWVSAVQKK